MSKIDLSDKGPYAQPDDEKQAKEQKITVQKLRRQRAADDLNTEEKELETEGEEEEKKEEKSITTDDLAKSKQPLAPEHKLEPGADKE